MNVVDALLLALDRAARVLLRGVWIRFRRLTLIGKGFGIALALFTTAWTTEWVGAEAVTGELMSAAGTVLSFAITAVIIRHIWLRFTRSSRYPTWY